MTHSKPSQLALSRYRKSLLAIPSLLVLMIPYSSTAQSTPTGNLGARIGSGAVAGAVVAVGAIAGGGIYLAVHHSHTSLNGCVNESNHGLRVTTNSGMSYELLNAPTEVRTGERLSFRGHRIKTASGPAFQVDHISGHHGACRLM